MIQDVHRDSYSTHRTPTRRRMFIQLYLILFGVIIGVLLVNTFITSRARFDAGGGDTEPVKAQTPPPLAASDYTEYEKRVIAATQKAMPAVVSIHTTGTRLVYYRFRDPFFNMLYGHRVGRKPINGMGSGVIIDPDGVVITNDHVINITNEENLEKKQGDLTISVVLSDGRTFEAAVVKNFPTQDIAVLKIDADALPFIEIGSSSDLVQGQTVLAIGNPFGDVLTGGLLGSQSTVTRGIISATKRNLTITNENVTRIYRNMLQTDASINEGNSGGALVDLRGKLVGINTAIFTAGGTGSIGIGFAFPADRVKLMLDIVRSEGEIGRWYTGISVQEMTGDLARSLGYDASGGVVITAVEKGSPGEKSGLERGDIIVRADGYAVTGAEDVTNIFKGSVPGEKVPLTIFRDGETREIELVVGSY